MMWPRAALALAAALLAPAAAIAETHDTPPAREDAPAPAPAPQSLIDRCTAGVCKARLTPDELAGQIQLLITARRFDEARPMLAALSQLPTHRFETRYLTGQLLSGTGDHKGASEQYKAILSDDPGQTRVRLELAREMMALGQTASADRQFKIAQRDDDLPEDVARTIRAVRDVIRAQRAWRVDIDFGIAPDTNINNATAADSVTILWAGQALPVTLDAAAKARSGIGETASISASFRTPVANNVALLADMDSAGTNYAGSSFDDYQVQIAAGAEVRVSPNAAVSTQLVGAQRWFGGHLVSRQTGVKAGFQARLSNVEQIGVQIDARRTDALFDPAYDGWQTAAYATYERAVSKALVVSGGVFARRDWLRADAYSSTELGVIAGFGGELPKGVTFGLSGSASHADFDAPIPLFSNDPRKDWRFTGRATLGNRKIDLWGFSPQISASYTRIDSSLPFFANDRLRFRFALARYF